MRYRGRAAARGTTDAEGKLTRAYLPSLRLDMLSMSLLVRE